MLGDIQIFAKIILVVLRFNFVHHLCKVRNLTCNVRTFSLSLRTEGLLEALYLKQTFSLAKRFVQGVFD